jgi:hypothetical protein
MESHIDNFRTGLLALFNTNKLSSINFSSGMNLVSAKFDDGSITSTDNAYVFLGSDNDCKFGLDGSKNWVFDTTASTTEIKIVTKDGDFIEIYTDKVVVNSIFFNGTANIGIKGILAKSRPKPTIEWYSTSAVSLQRNSATANTTILNFPEDVISVTEVVSTSAKYRWASVSNTANGYGTGHSGAASGGRRSGVSATSNSWYYVYACKLRSGTDFSSTTHKFIIVFDTLAPTQTNESTLDGHYGSGNWLYLGLVRYGYGATGSSSEIIKFKYSPRGHCILYGQATYAGLHLAYSTADADNTTALYTVATGTSGNVIPSIVGRCTYYVVRENVSDWYIKDSNGLIIWRGGWQTDDTDLEHGFMVELPMVAGMTFHQVRKGTGAVGKAVVLAGFTDPYRNVRNQGKGI